MKNEILKWGLTGALTLGVLLCFGQGIEKTVTAYSDSVVTGVDVHQARVDSTVDYRRFKAAAELKISENQKNINLLRSRKSVIEQRNQRNV